MKSSIKGKAAAIILLFLVIIVIQGISQQKTPLKTGVDKQIIFKRGQNQKISSLLDNERAVTIIEGDDINLDSVVNAIESVGGVIHSIDSVATGKRIVDQVETLQDK